MMDPPDTPTPASRQTAIPRLSRLPVPKSIPGLRPSPSRESLTGRTSSGLSLPRLRSTPSRDNLEYRSRTVSSGIRERDESANSSTRKPQPSSLLSKAPVRNVAITNSKSFTAPPPTNDMPPPSRDLDYDAAVYAPDEVITEEDTQEEYSQGRQSRPSLSERTMETLAQIPASPAMRQRRTSFYENTNSPSRPTSSSTVRSRSDNLSGPISKLTLGSRPGSSYSHDGSLGPPSSRSFSSRPTSSADDGVESWIPKPFRTTSHTQTSFSEDTQSELAEEQDTTWTATTGLTTSKLPSPGFYSARQRSPSPMRPTSKAASATSEGSTVPTKTVKPQRSINGMFNKPAVGLISSDILEKPRTVEKKASNSQLSLASKRGLPPRTKSTLSSKSVKSTSSQSSEAPTSPKKASAAQSSSILREQIAKAKAAKRAQLNKEAGGGAQGHAAITAVPGESFDFAAAEDPFNLLAGQGGNKGLLRKRIEAGRKDGRLNIAAMGLKEMPDEVMSMYEIEDASGGSWAEMVDLTRLVAADNEFEVIPDNIFPDIDAETAMQLDDWKGNQFGGLETLDLHGNILIGVPLGLRRLELLTTLNLSNNKLVNDAFDVISLIPNLKDLKIAVNNLTGELPTSIAKLEHLETLDIHGNKLTSLPDVLKELLHLRIINASENSFESLPFGALQHLPLTQLSVAKNKLSGTLIDSSVASLPQLQILDITSNALTSISDAEKLDLPALHLLSCSANRLKNLPDITTWLSLMVIAAEDNNISDIPTGFITLPKIKNVDFTGNNIKVIDDAIGGMESLDIFRISGNPLREKKLAGMTTEVLKRTLKARLEPADETPDVSLEETTDVDIVPVSNTSTPTWPVAANKLDRSNTQSRTLNPVIVAQVAQAHTVRTIDLHHNAFRDIPMSIAFFAATLTSLTISHNELTRDEYLDEELSLPALQILNLSSNTISDVRPLLARLDAPNLDVLDLSFNRLTSLPVLRAKFPKLSTLLVGNNTIRELSHEAVRGLRVLDASSNELQTLNPRLGLLWEEGLRQLSVTGNRFRVPRWDVLEKGTETTCAWLRDRIPVEG